ncbi:MAG: PrsW family intramembrane metalloprotease [Acidobacteriia bacterium]|nr:PrsW family intramembrane metalloprotease [Terriglobia bacterium]
MTREAALLWGLMAGILPVMGFLTALLSVGLSRLLLWSSGTSPDWYGRFGAPWLEEAVKVASLAFLIRPERVAFMVDAAICGFAAGAGFALLENLAYLEMLPGGGVPLFVLRGFGTAVMHGGATAIVGVIAIALRRMGRWRAMGLGLLVAIAIHTYGDAAILTPLQERLTVVLGLPPLFVLIFERSERAMHNWMGQKLNQDVELLDMLATGNFANTPAGQYLRSLSSFPPRVLGDMVCMLQISSELSAAAKGDRIQTWAGLPVEPDAQLESRLVELDFLGRSIGLAGRRALAPLLPLTSRDRSELRSLQDKARP